jgi:hypothetical protein
MSTLPADLDGCGRQEVPTVKSFSMRLILATVLALGAGLLIAGCAGSATNSTGDRAETTMAASAPRADFSGLVGIGGAARCT